MSGNCVLNLPFVAFCKGRILAGSCLPEPLISGVFCILGTATPAPIPDLHQDMHAIQLKSLALCSTALSSGEGTMQSVRYASTMRGPFMSIKNHFTQATEWWFFHVGRRIGMLHVTYPAFLTLRVVRN